jgi:hypothetical protein
VLESAEFIEDLLNAGERREVIEGALETEGIVGGLEPEECMGWRLKDVNRPFVDFADRHEVIGKMGVKVLSPVTGKSSTRDGQCLTQLFDAQIEELSETFDRGVGESLFNDLHRRAARFIIAKNFRQR